MHGRVSKQTASRASPASQGSSRYPLGGQTPRRWWPCWLHPPLLWWHWGCSHRQWQHPQHSVPAHPRWYFSLSWKMIQGEYRPCSILSLSGADILPVTALCCALANWSSGHNRETDLIASLDLTWTMGSRWDFGLDPALYPAPRS